MVRTTSGRNPPRSRFSGTQRLFAPLLIAGVSVSTLCSAPVALAQTEPGDGAAQYALLCARCHGLTGDGRGPEVFDRPARDFTAGGFSFGNTQEAIARTITHGIPGSPMPAFGETLAPDVIEALARHVRTLAPDTEEPAEAETILAVRDHPIVVRGGLPPITAGAAAYTRGMMLGLPGGLSFEYRVPDLVLLGVRAGEFARRADWTGRGGTSLEPLGQVLWLNERGTPRPSASYRTDAGNGEWNNAPLTAQLRATRTPTAGASISWDAVTPEGTLIAHVVEGLRAINTPFGAGFARVLQVSGPGSEPLVLHHGTSPGRPLERMSLGSWDGIVVERDEGGFELTMARTDAGEWSAPDSPEGFAITLSTLAGHEAGAQETTITFVTLLIDEWGAPQQDALNAALEAELAR